MWLGAEHVELQPRVGGRSHLDWLEAHLEGRSLEFSARYRELTPLYEDLAAAL